MTSANYDANANFERSYVLETGHFTQTQLVNHNGKLVGFALRSDRQLVYSVLDMDTQTGEEDQADHRNWSAQTRALDFPTEIRRVGYGDFAPPPIDVVSEDGAIDHFASTTAKFTADAPFQALSDGDHIFIFRAAISAAPFVEETLLVDRFVLVGDTVMPKMEVRYKRSRKKTWPASSSDTLSATDMAGRSFLEPTLELPMLGKISKGRFAVTLLPTQVADQKRWQFFVFHSETEAVDSYNIARSDDGLFDTQGARFYASPDPQYRSAIYQRSPGLDPYTKRPLIPVISKEDYSESAIRFDGKKHYARIEDDPIFAITQSYTVELWIKPRNIKEPLKNTDEWLAVFTKGSFDPGDIDKSERQYSFWISDGGALIQSFSTNANWNRWNRTPNYVLRNGTWHHIAATNGIETVEVDGRPITGRVARIFVDGKEAAPPLVLSRDETLKTNKHPIFLGAGISHLDREFHFFQGEIDEVRLWSERRSENAIREAMSYRLIGNEPGLKGYWRMDEGQGSSLRNQSAAKGTGRLFDKGSRPTRNDPKGNEAAADRWIRSDAPVGDHAGVRRASIRFAKAEGNKTLKVSAGMTSTLYHETEPTSADGKKPTKQNARVMLAVPVTEQDAQQAKVAVVDFAVSREGRLAQVPDLISLKEGTEDKTNETLEALTQQRFELEKSLEALRKTDLANPLNYECEVTLASAHGLSLGKRIVFHKQVGEDIYVAKSGSQVLTRKYHKQYNYLDLSMSTVEMAEASEATPIELEITKDEATSQYTIKARLSPGNSRKVVSGRFVNVREKITHNHFIGVEAGFLAHDLFSYDLTSDVVKLSLVSTSDRFRIEYGDKWLITKHGPFLGFSQADRSKILADLQTVKAKLATVSARSKPLSHLHVDRFGLISRAGLLDFAETNAAPSFLNSADGNLALYFQGAKDEKKTFQAAYYNTAAAKKSLALPTQGGTRLQFVSRHTGSEIEKTEIEIKKLATTNRGDDAFCRVRVKNTELGIDEVWDRVPRRASRFARVLNGEAGGFDYLGTVEKRGPGADLKVLTFQKATAMVAADKPFLRIGDSTPLPVGRTDGILPKGQIKQITLVEPLELALAPGSGLRISGLAFTVVKAEAGALRIAVSQTKINAAIPSGTEVRAELAPQHVNQLLNANRLVRNGLRLETDITDSAKMVLIGPGTKRTALNKRWGDALHLTVTLDAKQQICYLDGIALFSVDRPSPSLLDIGEIVVGTNGSRDDASFFDGFVSEVAVHNRRLNATDVLTSFRHQIPPSGAHLVGHWGAQDADLKTGLLPASVEGQVAGKLLGQFEKTSAGLRLSQSLQNAIELAFRPSLICKELTLEFRITPTRPAHGTMTVFEFVETGNRGAQVDSDVSVFEGTPVYGAEYDYAKLAPSALQQGSRLGRLALLQGDGQVLLKDSDFSSSPGGDIHSAWQAFGRGQALSLNADKVLSSAGPGVRENQPTHLSFRGPLTVEAWVQPSAALQNAVLVYNSGGLDGAAFKSSPNFLLGMTQGGKAAFGVNGNFYESKNSAFTPPSEDKPNDPAPWTHVAAAFEPAFALDFSANADDGVDNSYVNAAGEDAYNYTDELTIEVMFRTGEKTDTRQGLIAKGVFQSDLGVRMGVPYAIWIQDTRVHVRFDDDKGAAVAELSGGTLEPNTNYRVAVTRARSVSNPSALTESDMSFKSAFRGNDTTKDSGDDKLDKITRDNVGDHREDIDDFSRLRTVEGLRRERKGETLPHGLTPSIGAPGFKTRFTVNLHLQKEGEASAGVDQTTSNAATLGRNGYPLLIGAIESADKRRHGFRGAISEVRLWRAARHENQLFADPANDQSDLAAWWKFNEGSGQEVIEHVAQSKGRVHGKTKWVASPFAQDNLCQIYVNGTLQPYVSVSPQTAKTNFADGASAIWQKPQTSLGGIVDDGDAIKAGFKGRLNEIRVWNETRTREQLLDNLYTRLKGDRSKVAGNYQFEPTLRALPRVGDADSKQVIVVTDVLGRAPELGIVPELSFEAKKMGERAKDLFVLSTAPISRDTAMTQGALGDVYNAQFHVEIAARPSVQEYGDIQKNAEGETIGVLKRAYSYIGTNGIWHLITGYKVGDLVSEWVGQVQFNPQIKGYIEGAPPVPSENLTEGVKNPNVSNFVNATSVTFSQSRSVNYTLSDGMSGGFDTAFNMEFERSIKARIETVIAPLGIGINFAGEVDFGGKFGLSLNSSQTWTGDESYGSGENRSQDLVVSLGGDWEANEPDKFVNAAMHRRFQPSNMGFALVESDTADVFALRLAHNGALVALRFRPNPEIKRDVNIVPFPINPRYTKQGTLDGRVGYDGNGAVVQDPDYPQAKGYGEFSYLKPSEAYRLKQRITRESEGHKSQYESFIKHSAIGSLSNVIAGSLVPLLVTKGLKMPSSLSNGGTAFVAGIGAAATGLSAVLASLQHGVIEANTGLASDFAARSMVNTYVWTADGGVFSEETSHAYSHQETSATDYSFQGAVAGAMTIGGELDAGPKIGLEMNGTMGGHFNATKSKSKSTDQDFALTLALDPPGDLQAFARDPQTGALSRVYDPAGRPVYAPGKVDAYRFMSFMLSPSSDHFETLFNQVVDPIWLNQSSHPYAQAMRQARTSSRKPPCWRIMHRVTFVSRILPEFPDSAHAPLERVMREIDVKSHWELISRLDPFLRERATHLLERDGSIDAAFVDEVRRAMTLYLPQLDISDDRVFGDVLALLANYYGLADHGGTV